MTQITPNEIKNWLVESYSSKVVDKLGERVFNALADEIAKNPNFNVQKFFKEQQKIEKARTVEQSLRSLAEDRMSGEINGEVVDGFSAFMITRVLDQLTQEQRVKLLSKPTNEIITIAYKLASRSEI